jgi:putative ABC transport system permease protein
MTLLQAVLEALESLSANKLRSGLTILGIVIGVAAVIAMLGVGQGAQETITGTISGIGTNLLFVFRGNIQEDVRNPQFLTLGDSQAVNDVFLAPSVVAVAPVVQANNREVVYSGKRRLAQLNGVTPDYQKVRNYNLIEGEFINEEHMLGQASVVLVGPEVAKALFDRTEGITGEMVRLDGQPFRIIGVLESKGGGSFGSQDNVLMVPFTTATTRLIRRSRDQVDLLIVQAASPEVVKQAAEEVRQILRTRHRIIIGPDDFTVFTQEDFIQTAATITGVFTIFLGGIAGISLLVGGIGIMNIMLVSVTERTREIGLRKALGARRRDILIQFLTESSLLSLIGGVIGIGFGWLIAYVVGRIAEANNTPFSPAIGIDAILMATLFSTAVGLFFGLYPANRAAGLEPVEALRYE